MTNSSRPIVHPEDAKGIRMRMLESYRLCWLSWRARDRCSVHEFWWTVYSTADQGVIIPTSIGLIQYGVATGTSISDLFMAGFLPGIFICLVLCVVAHFLCKKQGFEPSERAATEEKVQAFKDAILALLMPVIISYLHWNRYRTYRDRRSSNLWKFHGCNGICSRKNS